MMDNIYQISTVMALHRFGSVFHSPIASSSVPSPLGTKKCPQSVSNRNTFAPSCTNHKRRRAGFFFLLPEGEILHFCQSCRDMIQMQGFTCSRIEEFNGKTLFLQGIARNSQLQKKERKDKLDSFLSKIKGLFEQTYPYEQITEETITKQFCNHSQHLSSLFQRLQQEILALRRSCLQQLQLSAGRFLHYYRELKLTISWTQEELFFLVDKIKGNTDRLINDGEFFNLNMRVFTQNLEEKQKKIRNAELAYNEHSNQFKLVRNNIEADMQLKIEKMSQMDKEKLCSISDIEPVDFGQSEDMTCREIVGQMSTRHTLG